MSDSRFMVRRYISEGWSVIPIPKGEKGPRVANWQNTEFTEADFAPDDNIGVRLGDPSQGLTDIDLDCAEAIRAASQLLLKTERIHGRPGKQQSHYWFIAPGAKAEQFKDTDGSVLVEIRSTGGQTVLPPSTHPSGETLGWEIDREPGHVDPKGLRDSVLRVATTALLSRHWPAGSRHVCSGLAAGFLAARGLEPIDVELIIRTAATIAGDEEVDDRARYARETAAKFVKGDVKVAGGPVLAEHLGEDVVKRLRDWFGVGHDSTVDEMNTKHFVVRVGAKDVVGMDTGKVFVFQNPDSLRLRYANERVKIGTSKKGDQYKSKFEIWLEHPRRRSFGTVVFAPPPIVPDPKDLNLWRGFAVEPKDGDCHLLLAHIRDVICSENDEHYEFLMDLLALGVQQPGVRSEIATVLRGPQGSGKGIFIRAYGELFGDHFVHLDSPEDLVGHFNAHLSGKVVVFADEAFFAGDFTIRGTLKRMITEPTIRVTYKGVDSNYELNCIHLFMATNNEWAVPSENKERRHFVVNVAEARAQDHVYFGRLTRELESGGRSAFLYLLLNRTIDRERLRKIPHSDALIEQQALSLNLEYKWWRECLAAGEILMNVRWPDWISSQDLHYAYLTWCDLMKMNRRATSGELCKRISKFFAKADSVKRVSQDRDETGRLVPGQKSKKRGWLLGTIVESREIFDRETLGQSKHNRWPAVDVDGDAPIETQPAEVPGADDVEF